MPIGIFSFANRLVGRCDFAKTKSPLLLPETESKWFIVAFNNTRESGKEESSFFSL